MRYTHSIDKGQWEFYVHYAGWNARWDQWRTARELVPDTPDERAKWNQANTATETTTMTMTDATTTAVIPESGSGTSSASMLIRKTRDTTNGTSGSGASQ